MHSFEDIGSALSYTNQLMLSYSLHASDVVQRGPDDEKVKADLEQKITQGARKIFAREGDVETLSLEGIWSQLQTIQENVDDTPIFNYRLDKLEELKTKIVSHHQGCLLQRVKSFIDPLAGVCRSMSAETDAEKAFPLIYDSFTQDQRSANLDNFQQLLREGGPDEIELYFEEIQRLIFSGDDIRGGSEMLKSLEEQMFFWSMSPSTAGHGSHREDESENRLKEKLVDRFGPYRYGYARLSVELGEVKTRLSNIKSGWRELLVQTFKNDYGENMERDEQRLMELGEEIGSGDLLERIESGEVHIPNILKQVASLGPAHLDMVIEHIEVFMHKIDTDVFGNDPVRPSTPAKERYMVITEPRKFVVVDDDLMKRYGVISDEISLLGNEVYGLLSTYTVLSWPPAKYDGPVPKKAKKYAGNLYKGDRFTVIDIYADMLDAPEEIVTAYLEGRSMDSPEVREMLTSARLPRGSYQVRIPSDLLLRPDLSVIAEGRRMQNIDGKVQAVYEIELPRRDLGAHDTIRQLVAENPHSDIMTRSEFERRIRSGRLF